MLNNAGNLARSEHVLLFHKDLRRTANLEEIIVGSTAKIISAYNLEVGDTLEFISILSTPDARCVGSYMMRPRFCGCALQLYNRGGGDIRNMMLLDMPGRYSVEYTGDRTNNLIVLVQDTDLPADYGTLTKAECC